MPSSSEHFLLRVAQYATLAFPVAIAVGNAYADIVGSLVAAVFILHLLWHRQWQLLDHDWVKLGIAYWLFRIASALWAHDPLLALQSGFIWGRFLFFGIALAYWVFDDAAMQKRFFLILAAVLAFLGVDALYQYYAGVDLLGHPKFSDRLTGPFNNPYIGAVILYILFPILAYAVGNQASIRVRIIGVSTAFAGALAIILSGERSPTLLLLLGLALLFILLLRRHMLKPYLIFLAVLALGLALQVGVLDRFSAGSKDFVKERQWVSTWQIISHFDQSLYGLLWKDAADLIGRYPLLGVGAGNIRVHWCQLGEQKYFPEGCPLHPHNPYLEIWGSTGLAGLSLYLLMIACLLRRFYSARPMWRGDAVTTGIVVALCVRLWPLIAVTSHTRSLSAFTFWLMVGWGLSRIRRWSADETRH